MSKRISIAQLEGIVARINTLTGNSQECYTRENGRSIANIGNYHLSQQYGGVALHQMVSNGGGARDVFNSGHIPKRELFDMMTAYMYGLYDSQEKGV